MTKPTPISNAVQAYREQLKSRNINDLEARKLGLKCLSAEECSALLGTQTRYSGMLLPYPHTDSYFRIRMFGGERKYLGAKGSGTSPPYLSSLAPWNWEDLRVDASKPVIITEGEFKGIEGCRTGVPTIGLGGVDMQATLFTTGWVWTGRPVFVCFDQDAGVEPGQYRPGVANALGKLCSSLRQHGAIVKVLHIGLVCPDPAKKWGLDDLLLSEGTEVMGKLLETASDPPEWCSKLADMLDDCVYVTGTNHVHIFKL